MKVTTPDGYVIEAEAAEILQLLKGEPPAGKQIVQHVVTVANVDELKREVNRHEAMHHPAVPARNQPGTSRAGRRPGREHDAKQWLDYAINLSQPFTARQLSEQANSLSDSTGMLAIQRCLLPSGWVERVSEPYNAGRRGTQPGTWKVTAIGYAAAGMRVGNREEIRLHPRHCRMLNRLARNNWVTYSELLRHSAITQPQLSLRLGHLEKLGLAEHETGNGWRLTQRASEVDIIEDPSV